MAEFNLEGLLGNVFGGGNYLDEYLTPEQRAAMQRNAMLAASAALLKAGGESTRRIGIGEALGEALQAGQGGYEKAQTGALTQMSLKQKMDEAKKAKELNARLAGIMGASATGEMESPEVTANKLMQSGRAAMDAGDFTRGFDFYKQAREVNPPDEVQGAPFEGTDAQGKPVLLQQMKSGVTRPVFGYGAKPEAAAAPIEVTGPDGKPMLVTPQRGGVYTPVVGYGPKQGAIGQPIEMTDAQGKPVMVQQMPDGSFRPVVGFTPKRAAPAADKAPRTQQVQLEDGTIGLINMDTGAFTPSTVGGVGGVAAKGKGTALTESQSNAMGFAQRMERVNGILKPLEEKGAYPGVGSAIAGAIPFVGGTAARLAQNADVQRYQQAASDWIRAKLRKESGAAIGADEAKQEYATYFPVTGDSAAVIEQKRQARMVATEAMKMSAGKTYTPPAPVVPGAGGSGLTWDPTQKKFVNR